jgi:hypothetical protein
MENLKNFIRKHDELCILATIILIVAGLLTTAFGVEHHRQTKARNQAIARAKSMDGKIYSINQVGWNWVGDTQLTLKNERQENAGSIMMYMANPFDSKINPLTLAFTHPHDRVCPSEDVNGNCAPGPMRVKAHFRETPWADKYDGKIKDGFTGSYLEFEVL